MMKFENGRITMTVPFQNVLNYFLIPIQERLAHWAEGYQKQPSQYASPSKAWWGPGMSVLRGHHWKTKTGL